MTETETRPPLHVSGRSTTIGGLIAALAKVQQDLPTVPQSEEVTVRGKTRDGTPFEYSYTYATLARVSEAVLPKLGQNGLAFVAWTQWTDRGFALCYQLIHESNEWISGEYPLPVNADPKEIGGIITYARRYCLCAVTGVVSERDTDAQGTRPYSYDDQPYSRGARQETSSGPSPQSAKLAYLRQVVQEKGLNEELVPQAYHDWSGGVPI